MSESILQQLQHSAQLALNSQSVEEGVQHLSRAFSLFSEEASRLKNAYATLQERFDSVNRELGVKVFAPIDKLECAGQREFVGPGR